MPNDLHQTTWCIEKGIEFIEKSRNEGSERPWCISLNPYAPHPPFDPPKEYVERLRTQDMPLPLWQEGELDNKPANQKESYLKGSQSGMLVPGAQVSDEEKRENTIVMFMSDHGEMLGDHGLYWKGGLFLSAMCMCR